MYGRARKVLFLFPVPVMIYNIVYHKFSIPKRNRYASHLCHIEHHHLFVLSITYILSSDNRSNGHDWRIMSEITENRSKIVDKLYIVLICVM